MATLLLELGTAVKARRTDMGLSQTALAKLSGLSRATVNQVENSTLKDLSLKRAAQLLGVLGLSLEVPPVHGRQAREPAHSALDIAARTASTSYRAPLTAKALRRSLEQGKLPQGFEPHMAVLLDEAPVSLLGRMVEELHAQGGSDRATLWRHMREMARSLACSRDLWQ